MIVISFIDDKGTRELTPEVEDNQDNAQDHEEDKKDDTSDESSRWNFKIYKHSSKNKCFKIKQV